MISSFWTETSLCDPGALHTGRILGSFVQGIKKSVFCSRLLETQDFIFLSCLKPESWKYIEVVINGILLVGPGSAPCSVEEKDLPAPNTAIPSMEKTKLESLFSNNF